MKKVILINPSIHPRTQGVATSIEMSKGQIMRVIKEHLPAKIKSEDIDFVAQVLVEHENEIIKVSTFE